MVPFHDLLVKRYIVTLLHVTCLSPSAGASRPPPGFSPSHKEHLPMTDSVWGPAEQRPLGKPRYVCVCVCVCVCVSVCVVCVIVCSCNDIFFKSMLTINPHALPLQVFLRCLGPLQPYNHISNQLSPILSPRQPPECYYQMPLPLTPICYHNNQSTVLPLFGVALDSLPPLPLVPCISSFRLVSYHLYPVQ